MGLAKCRKTDPQITVEKVILILTKMITRLNIDRNMTPMQVQYCAEDIVNTDDALIYNLTLDELNLCMDKGVKGEYGIVYNRMDQSIVFEWIRMYIEEKLQTYERIRSVDDGDNRKNVQEIFQNDTMHTILTDVVSKLSIKEEKKPEPVRVVTPEQEVVNSWISDFDRIYEQSGNDTGTVRMVPDASGNLIGLSQYLDNRLKEYNENK